ncbi:hypothetical protein OG590_09635 [Streptomyces goshikiensis]|uniref:hypothetical protein n=1 Tax=Streptomyces goshikiensis TaxID=1942 RepID=UPI003867DE42|nr:hypothetical protein OG590_09635 [Streptomyces goshikiensis]
MRAVLAWFRDSGDAPGTTLTLAELGFTAELRGARTLPGPCTPKDWRPRGRWETYAPWRWPWRGWRAPRRRAANPGGRPGRSAPPGRPGAPLPPAERHDVDRIWSACRSAPGPAAADAALARGATHPTEAEPARGPAVGRAASRPK